MGTKIIKIYKVRQKSTGLFSCGGTKNNFSINGKTWNQIGHVKNYLRELIPKSFYYDKNISVEEKSKILEKLQDLEVVEFRLEISPLDDNIINMDYKSAINGGSF